MRVQLSISLRFARQLSLVLGLVVAVLAALSSASEALLSSSIFSGLLQQGGSDDGQTAIFALNAEGNLPSWYSSSSLLICAGLLALISLASRGKVYRLQWAGLSLVFLYLSADESVSIHEKASSLIGMLLPFEGFSNFAWVIVYAPLTVIFGLFYVNFARSLPVETKRLFVVAGILYVVGALGMEAVDGLYASFYGESNIIYYLLTQIEEILEMLGVVVFFYALLLYMSLYIKEINVGSKI